MYSKIPIWGFFFTEDEAFFCSQWSLTWSALAPTARVPRGGTAMALSRGWTRRTSPATGAPSRPRTGGQPGCMHAHARGTCATGGRRPSGGDCNRWGEGEEGEGEGGGRGRWNGSLCPLRQCQGRRRRRKQRLPLQCRPSGRRDVGSRQDSLTIFFSCKKREINCCKFVAIRALPTGYTVPTNNVLPDTLSRIAHL